MSVKFIIGDTRDVTATLPDGSVDLIMTSPPFLALRSYLPASHPDKHREIGSEPNPAAFIDTLLELTAEWGRVLAPHGTLAVELGDTYSGGGTLGGETYKDRTAERVTLADGRSIPGSGATNGQPRSGDYWPLAKSLALIPQLYAVALAYGINPLTGAPSPAGRWRVRNWIAWHRPNPPVGCVDAETEALTLDGWKRHDDLADGDLIAVYDPKSDTCRFEPASFVRWHRDGEPMVAVDKRATSQMLTEDHRCLTRTRKRAPFVSLAADLTNDCETLLCAAFEDIPGPAPVTAERAALLGWYIAEGSTKYRQVRIVQSATANPEKVARIRALLDADGADYRESVYHHVIERAPSRSHKPPYDDLVSFTIKGELAEWLMLHHKRLPMTYVTCWPEAQAQALFDALIDGDGHRRKNADGVLFHQQAEGVADAVQVLALRLGYRATKSWQPTMGLWQITMSRGSRWTKLRKWDGPGLRREVYTGVVWCPQVETSFWLARRNGKTFVTGNSLGDKWRPASSYITVACRGAKRWFDLDAVRGEDGVDTPRTPSAKALAANEQALPSRRTFSAGGGAPPLDWHEDGDLGTGHIILTTQPYKGSHYATFPVELPRKIIASMCPRAVCRVCGVARERMTSEPTYVQTRNGKTPAVLDYRDGHDAHDERHADKGGTGRLSPNTSGMGDSSATRVAPTLGWTDCKCDHFFTSPDGRAVSKWRPGVTFDPFCGTGTVLEAAQDLGRDAIGIDIDIRNADLARERVGMFLEVDDRRGPVVVDVTSPAQLI